MKAVIDVHILQNFPPSNLNRDGTGSPKTASFGGVTRGRWSSQSIKRSLRLALEQQLGEQHATVRTKLAARHLAAALTERGLAPEAAEAAARTAIEEGLGVPLGGADTADPLADAPEEGAKKPAKKAGRKKGDATNVLLFLGRQELERLAELITTDPDAFVKGKLPAPLKRELVKRFDGMSAAGVALFGRFIAKAPELRIDGSVSVAHAITTGRVEIDHDYFVAMDDLLPAGESGADMIGTVDLASHTYYRYASIDVLDTLKNAQGDKELTKLYIAGFIQQFIDVRPSSMLRSTAPYTRPEFIGLNLTRDGAPLSLVNAFDEPVKGEGLMARSIHALDAHHQAMKDVYQPNTHSAAVTTTPVESFQQVTTAAELLELAGAFLDAALAEADRA